MDEKKWVYRKAHPLFCYMIGIALLHHPDARGGSQSSRYRRKDGDDELDDFLPKFFLVHVCDV